VAAGTLLAAGVLLGAWAAPAADNKAPAQLSEDQAAKIAEDAYVFGYPLVLMDVTEKLSTAVPKPEGSQAPINQFAHLRAFPDATYTDIVSPNADTLYSLAWLDVAKEPIVLSVPARGARGAGRGTSPSSGRNGRGSCPRASRSCGPRRTQSGFAVALRRMARRTTRRSAPSRTSTS
jgi:hypothetical protein